MFNTLRRAGLLAFSALVLPGALAAQFRPAETRVPTPAAGAGAEAREWYNELQRISTRLQQAHGRAMQDARLRTAQETLMRDFKAAMLRADPALDSLAGRVKEMEREAVGAQQRGDRARLQTLQRELARIQTRFVNAQKAATEQPAIAQRSRAFETQLRTRMLQVEPQTDQLLERANELRSRLVRLQQQRTQSGQQRPQSTGPTRQRSPE